MTPAQILYLNLIDSGTVSASSSIASAPASRLQNPHVKRRWSGRNGATETIDFDLGSAQSISAVCLFGLQVINASDDQVNMDATAVRQIKLSTVSIGASDAYDSLSAAGKIKSAYGAMVELFSARSVRYGRISLTQAGATALLAGRLVAGLRSTYRYNFGYGWGEGYVDMSRLTDSAGGSTFIDRDDKYRLLSVTFESLDEADKKTFVRDLLRINGISDDLLFITDPESTDITADCIWGLMQNLQMITQPNFAFFAHPLSIKERG